MNLPSPDELPCRICPLYTSERKSGADSAQLDSMLCELRAFSRKLKPEERPG